MKIVFSQEDHKHVRVASAVAGLSLNQWMYQAVMKQATKAVERFVRQREQEKLAVSAAMEAGIHDLLMTLPLEPQEPPTEDGDDAHPAE